MDSKKKAPGMPPPPADTGRPGSAAGITRAYFDSLLYQLRYLDGGVPDTRVELFGRTFSSPVMTAALSHLGEDGTVVQAEAARQVNCLNWVGLCSDGELRRICATGAATVRVIKPFADEARIFREMEAAEESGCIAVGMDIDHAFEPSGRLCVLEGAAMEPKSQAQLRRYAAATGLPFIAKGVLSVTDAVKCADAGLAGILVSHHGGKMDYAAAPLMLLPDIKAAVGGRLKIFVDCGVESGHDVFKALALGADAVGIGKALMPAILRGGAEAVARQLQGYMEQLGAVMAFTACRTPADITPDLILRRP